MGVSKTSSGLISPLDMPPLVLCLLLMLVSVGYSDNPERNGRRDNSNKLLGLTLEEARELVKEEDIYYNGTKIEMVEWDDDEYIASRLIVLGPDDDEKIYEILSNGPQSNKR